MCDSVPVGNVSQGERTIQVDVHPQAVGRPNQGQYFVLHQKPSETINQIRTTGVLNSTRWNDIETRHLLEIWAARYASLRFKKRNFKDWELIAKEVHKRCVMNGTLGLGPRTGSQCKIRIKNILADYKRNKGEYSGNNSKHLSPFFGMIDKVLKKCDNGDSTQLSEEFDDQKVKDDDVTLQLQPEVQVQASVTSPLTQAVTAVVASPSFTVPSMVLSSFPSSYSNALATSSMTTNHISLAALHSNGLEAQPKELTAGQQDSHSSSHSSFKDNQRELVAKKKLRKNPRPYKVVKVTRKVNEDDKLLTIVREFMEERRKREEELFDRLFQQQSEAEKRYQEFTLNVIKEIGRLFKPESSKN